MIVKMNMVADKNAGSEIKGLKAQREALGLSLRDVFHRTRVSVNYLRAIEDEDFNLLPEPVYAKNFIRTYARALGVDEKNIIDRYDAYLDSLKILENVPPREEMARQGFFSAFFAKHRSFLVVVFVLAAVLVIIWLVSMQYWTAQNIKTDRSALERRMDIASEAEQSTQEGTLAAAGAEEEVAGQERAAAEKTASPAPPGDEGENGLLVIRATEETWLRIKIDQKPVFQIVLKPGQKAEYKASVVDMDIGNAAGVVIQFRGKTMENLGEAGEAIRLRLP